MTRLTPDAPQKEVLDARKNLVVVGRPGSGKTTVALWKAAAVIEEATLLDHQSVLFLSFSRGAVERIGAESRMHLTARQRKRLQIATYHSLCFDILQAHAPALGMKRPVRILSTEDEVIVEREHGDGDIEFARLETDESRVRFDRFAPLACQILKCRPVLRDAYQRAYPLIFVDEYQDTDDFQEELIGLLADQSQLICLGDPNQRIYDFRPKMRSDRLERLVSDRGFRLIDLATSNHRSAGHGIREYAEAAMAGSSASCSRITVWMTGSKFKHVIAKVVSAVGYLRQRGATEGWAPSGRCSIAIMLPTNNLVQRVSHELRSLPEPDRSKYRHDVLIDLDDVSIAWATLLTVLEHGSRRDVPRGITAVLECLLRRIRFTGLSTNRQRVEQWLADSRTGALKNKGLPGELKRLVDTCYRGFTGDVVADMARAKDLLAQIPGDYFDFVLNVLGLRMPGEGEPHLRQQLSEAFHKADGYAGLVDIAEHHIASERLFDAGSRKAPLTLMTLHKCKGKEFDAVIIAEGTGPQDVLVRRDERDSELKPNSRRLLHVGITRAKQRVVILTPAYQKTPLLPH